MYKLAFRRTDEIATEVDLGQFEWMLYPKIWKTNLEPVLEGALVDVDYKDGHQYRARIYRARKDGRICVAYLDTDDTDIVKMGKWRIVEESPCIAKGRR